VDEALLGVAHRGEASLGLLSPPPPPQFQRLFRPSVARNGACAVAVRRGVWGMDCLGLRSESAAAKAAAETEGMDACRACGSPFGKAATRGDFSSGGERKGERSREQARGNLPQSAPPPWGANSDATWDPPNDLLYNSRHGDWDLPQLPQLVIQATQQVDTLVDLALGEKARGDRARGLRASGNSSCTLPARGDCCNDVPPAEKTNCERSTSSLYNCPHFPRLPPDFAS